MDQTQKTIDEINDKLREHRSKYEKYDYEKYHAIYPNLTEEVYKMLYENRSLWKVKLGIQVSTHWGQVLLPAAPILFNKDLYNRRFLHGYDGYVW